MTPPSDLRTFARYVVTAAGIAVAIVVAVYLGLKAISVLLLLFAGVVFSVFLSGLASNLAQRTPLSRGWALLLVVVILAGIIVIAGWLLGPRVAEQVQELGTQLPDAIEHVRTQLASYGWGEALLSRTSEAGQMSGSDALRRVAGVFSTVLGVLGGLLVVLFVGLYMAADPNLYVRGALLLVPPSNRREARNVLEMLGHALGWWLAGRMGTMTVVGVFTALGLWLLGVPLALTLGLIAAVLSFIPYLGPVLSAVPAVLIGLMESPPKALQVAALYLGVQLVESYLITPFIQQRAVSIAPAMLIAAQLFLGALTGILGVLLATPLAVVMIVLVQRLYVEDTLGDSVEVLGEHGG